jgi:hypothetical protein
MKNRIIFLALIFIQVLSAEAQKTIVPVNKKPKPTVKKPVPVKPSRNYITTYYEEPYDSANMMWYNDFKEIHFLEDMAKVLNSVLKINKPLKLAMRECGFVNATYNPEEKELTLCYELLRFMDEQYLKDNKPSDSLYTQIGHALAFIYFHEIGHAMIDLLDIPLTGKEEDAADYFAFYFLASNEVPVGVDAAMECAKFFKKLSQFKDSVNLVRVKKGEKVELPFWDEHSFEMQRFYSIFSLIYGSNPEKYDYLIADGFLGERRPQIAINEFKKIKRGWDRVLKDHIKWHK